MLTPLLIVILVFWDAVAVFNPPRTVPYLAKLREVLTSCKEFLKVHENNNPHPKHPLVGPIDEVQE